MERFSNIMFVTDSETADTESRAAFSRAVSLASNNQARLTIVDVVTGSSFRKKGASIRDAMAKHKQDEIEKLVRSVSTTQVDIETSLLEGKAFLEIIREALRRNCDLVIKAISDRGTGRSVFGSTDKSLLRKCPCPVWLIKAYEHKQYRQILVALDYEPDNPENEQLNQRLLDMAVALAFSEFSELHVVHAWQLEHEDFLRSPRMACTDSEVDEMARAEEIQRHGWLLQLVAERCAASGREAADYLDPQIHLVKGRADAVVPRYAKAQRAELVIMGTVARTGIPGLVIGNTAESILGQLDCSVLALKPAGFASPISVPDQQATNG